jgi:hypothetical protein
MSTQGVPVFKIFALRFEAMMIHMTLIAEVCTFTVVSFSTVVASTELVKANLVGRCPPEALSCILA